MPRLLILLLLSLPLLQAEEAQWTTLFDGKTLNGWTATSDANWHVENGAIIVSEGKPGFLIHEDHYTNYELTLEFKAAMGTNSGVFLSTTREPKTLTEDCYELNIAPPDNPFPTGSLVAREKVSGIEETDSWRKYDIRVVGAHVTVQLDGNEILNYQADKPASGHLIGLQKNSGLVAFRNIRVRKLP